MKRKLISDALNEVDPEYIAKAATPVKKRRHLPWVAAVAAAAVIAVLINTLGIGASNGPVKPGAYSRHQVAAPVYPAVYKYPGEDNWDAYQQWMDGQDALHQNPAGYADNLQGYFEKALPLFLAGDGAENAVCSPLNIYIALAMLAEISEGESREQLLTLLDADSIESLRTQAGLVWRSHYNDDGQTTSLLGSSLWLDDSMPNYNKETAQLLAQYYYASVFRGDLGSSTMNKALQSWLDAQTGGMLKEQAGQIEMSPRTILALASTVFYQVQWQGRFLEELNTQAVFHGTAGDTTETFMNQQFYGNLYRGDSFSAVPLSLKDGSRMWLFLPDLGTTPEDLLTEGEALRFLFQGREEQASLRQSAQINLSVPKFDIAADTQLKEPLQELGITEVFQEFQADFSPIFPENDGIVGYVDSISHAARVSINEDGVAAAAFTVILMEANSAAPPEEKIDFILDRPFLFVIESQDGLPLFAGTVHQP